MPYIHTNDASFFLAEGENLLEALERTGHKIEYQCRQGYCGSCRTKITSGQVSYQQMPLAFIGQDKVLPCCCVPKNDLTLDINRHDNLDSSLDLKWHQKKSDKI